MRPPRLARAAGLLADVLGGAHRAVGALREAIDAPPAGAAGRDDPGTGADAAPRRPPAPPRVVAYRGYANRRAALLQARVVRDPVPDPADPGHSRWRNLRDALRRIRTAPVPHARVRALLGGAMHDIAADGEGFVHRWVTLAAPLAPGAWHPVAFALDDAGAPPPAARAGAESDDDARTDGVLVPPATARLGIVSDMDDTVLQSEVGSFLRAARMVLLENARTRLPFPGVAAYYRALRDGPHGATRPQGNPIFYVSSSPWNLYDVIAEFLEAQRIPAGPLLLRDWDLGPALASSAPHKRARIAEVFATYPELPFLLVGDSTQEDPEIYGALAREHPGRVAAIHIRDVGGDARRSAAIRALAEDARAAGTPLVLAPDTLTLARDAAARGWLAADAVDAVARASAADGARPAPD